jgi:hypothetical protein
VPYFVESLLNVKVDAGTYFLSFHALFYFIDDSVALLDCGVVASEAKLVLGDDVVNRYWFFYSLENKSFEYFGQCRQKSNRSVRVSFGWRFSGLGYHNNLGVFPLHRKVA